MQTGKDPVDTGAETETTVGLFCSECWRFGWLQRETGGKGGRSG